MTSSAYNHSLLKTIRVPLHESLSHIASNLEAVLEARLPAKDIGAADINNVIGSVTMVGRPSLVVVAHLLKNALVAMERSDDLAWDTIQVAAVARPAMELTRALSDLLVALERGDLDDQHLPGRPGEASTMLGEASSSVQLAPLLSRLTEALGESPLDLARLFDPDPAFPGVEFAALEPSALRDVAAVHVARLDQAVGEYLNLVPLPPENVTGTSLPPGQAFLSPIPEGAQGQILAPEPVVLSASLQDLLNTVGAAADWAFVQKHRLGYQGYWLAWRARSAWELQKAALNQPTNAVALGQALDSARTEMRKFAGDVRRPRPTAMFQVLEPLLRPWPKDWTARVQPLADASKAFGLEMFWAARERAERGLLRHQERKNVSGSTSYQSDSYQENADTSSENSQEASMSPILSDPIQAASWRSAVSDIQSAWTGFAAPQEGTRSDVMPLRRGLAMFLPRYEQAFHPGASDFRAALKITALRLETEVPPRPSPEVVQEVAVLLVLLDDDIARVGRWPAEWPEKAALANARVQAAWSNQIDVLQALPPVVWDATRRRQQSQDAVSRIARVVQEDLRGVEEVFDEFIRRDAAEARTQADDVRVRLSRDASVMRSIGQNTAADVLDVVVLRSAALKKAPRDAAAEMADVTVGLAAVTAFLESFGRGAPDALSLLSSPRSRFGLKAGAPDHLFSDFTGEALARSMLEEAPAGEAENGVAGADDDTDEFSHTLTGEPTLSDEETENYAQQAADGSAPSSPSDFEQPSVQEAKSTSAAEAAVQPAGFDPDEVPQAPPVDAYPDEAPETIPSDDPIADDGEVRQSALDAAQASARIWMDNVLASNGSDAEGIEPWTDVVTDKDIAEALFEEAGEVFSGLDDARQLWLDAPADAEKLTDLRRAFHTIKGSGRTASLFGVGEYARVLEDRLSDVRDSLKDTVVLDQALVLSIDALVELGHQTLEMALDTLSTTGSFTFTQGMLKDLADYQADSYLTAVSPSEGHGEDYPVDRVAAPFGSADHLFDDLAASASGPESETQEPEPMEPEPMEPEPLEPEHIDVAASSIIRVVQSGGAEEADAVAVAVDERDPVLIDVDTHLENLIGEVEDLDGPNPGRLMWSAHTVKTLSMGIHPRLSTYARLLENDLEPWSDLREEEAEPAAPWTESDRSVWRWHAATLVDLLRLWIANPSALDVWTLSADVASENAQEWSGRTTQPSQDGQPSAGIPQSDLIAVADQVNKLADGMDQLGTLLERMIQQPED